MTGPRLAAAMKPQLLLSLVSLSALALAGCTGGDDGPTFQTPPQDDEGRYVIDMLANNRFSPMYAEVPAGSAVIWVNKAGVHTATADDGSWDSGNLNPDQTYTRTFETPGDYEYHCTPHKSLGMTGTVRVV